MPLWAWHRPTLFFVAWILVAAVCSVRNQTIPGVTFFKSTTVQQFPDLTQSNVSLKEDFSQSSTVLTSDSDLVAAGNLPPVVSSETPNVPNTATEQSVSDGIRNDIETIRKETLGDHAAFGTKILLRDSQHAGSSVHEESAKEGTTLFQDTTTPNMPENNRSSSFGTKVQNDEHAQNDAKVGFQQNAIRQDGTMEELDSNSTSPMNSVVHDLSEVENSSANQSSSLETFTRAHLLSSVHDYDDDIIDSGYFTKTTFPYGSRFYPKTSVFYSNVDSPQVSESRWSSDMWSPQYTSQWMDPFTSCSLMECGSDNAHISVATPVLSPFFSSGPSSSLFDSATSSPVFGSDPVNPLFGSDPVSPLFGSDPVSPLFFRTDRELWVNNYKGSTYIDPSYTVTEITRVQSRNPYNVSPKGDAESSDVASLLDYGTLDEDFGMRITSTKVFPSVPSRTDTFLNGLSSERNRISNGNAEITADNTIPVEIQKKTKDFESRDTLELGPSYTNGVNVNFPPQGGFSESTVLKTNKWTTVKAADENTHSEINIRLGNSSRTLTTSDLLYPVTNSERSGSQSNSMLQSVDLINQPNVTSENAQFKFISATPATSQEYAFNSFGVFHVADVTSEPQRTIHESTTREGKTEIKNANVSFGDTTYQRNVIVHNKQDKGLKSITTAQQRSSDFASSWPQSRNPFHFSDIFSGDSVNEDQIPMYSSAFYTSEPFLVTSSDYDVFFGDRLFSKQPSTKTFDIVSPVMVETVDVNKAPFPPYLLSSFYDMSSSYDPLSLYSPFPATPFMYSSLMNSDYMLSSYWERERPQISALKESGIFPKASSMIIHDGDKDTFSSTKIEPTPVFVRSSSIETLPMLDSSILFFLSSSHPHMSAGKNRTYVRESISTAELSSSVTTEPAWDHKDVTEDHDVPPPRITNPSCSTLPTCITMTISMSWSEFCPVSDHLREQLANSLSQIIKPIHPHQLVLSSDHHQCKAAGLENELIAKRKRRRRRRRRSETFVEIRIFVIDHDGEYDEKLTEICGVILKKWMPTAVAPFQNKILEVRVSHIGEDILEEAGAPETVPAESPTSTGIIAAITISTIAGACLFLLCILLVVMKQRLLQNRNCNPALDAYSLDSFSINASFRRRRVRQSMRSFLNHAFEDPELPSHPLTESDLVNCLKNTEFLEEEFKKLPMNMPKLEQIPSGAEVKNRYANVVPNPDTRVPLSVSTEDPLKEYINANFIKGYDGKHRAYIATQAPLPETVNDFWQMVWEQQCKVVLMLTLLEENGVPRCAPYFPESTLDCHKLYGDFQVSLQKKDIREFYTMSTFRLYHLEKNLFREVAHFWYTAWPATGVPSDPGYLVTYLLQARPFVNTNSGPTVVHCSPGTGRTGVILALDMSMREFEQSRSVDVLRCLARIRKDRGGAVQTKEQYILLHEAVLEYASYIANQSHRPSIRSND